MWQKDRDSRNTGPILILANTNLDEVLCYSSNRNRKRNDKKQVILLLGRDRMPRHVQHVFNWLIPYIKITIIMGDAENCTQYR